MEYKIIGGDGVEYGPVSLDDIREWVREGRIGRNTLVWRSDTKTWNAASTFAELQAELTQLYGGRPDLQEQTFEAVGFWPRLAAYLVDRIVLWIVFYAAWEVIARMLDIKTPEQPAISTSPEKAMKFLFDEYLPFALQQLALLFPIHIAYEVTLNGRFGATLGKLIIGARIVRMDGSRLGYGMAFLRWLAERLSDFTCYIGYLFVAFREDKRAMHDLIVGTRVIYKR